MWTDRRWGGRWLDRLFQLILLLSLGLNVILANQLQAVTSRFDNLLAATAFGVGTPAAPFEAHEGDGNLISLDFGGPRPVLLYMVSATCRATALNRARAADLVAQLRDRVDVYFVALDSEESIADELGVPEGVRLLHRPTPQTTVSFKLGATPHTLYVQDGIIKGGWVGTYVSGNARHMSAVLGVTLATR